MRSASSNFVPLGSDVGSSVRFSGPKGLWHSSLNPVMSYQAVSGKCRLRKFPFSLIYSMEKEGLLILAVAHHRRPPGYWAHRLSVTGR